MKFECSPLLHKSKTELHVVDQCRSFIHIPTTTSALVAFSHNIRVLAPRVSFGAAPTPLPLSVHSRDSPLRGARRARARTIPNISIDTTRARRRLLACTGVGATEYPLPPPGLRVIFTCGETRTTRGAARAHDGVRTPA